MIGTLQPRASRRCTISGTAAAASSLLTVMRTSSLPACASAYTCAAVDSASAVSVFVIALTTIGCPGPHGTSPTRTVTVLRRSGIFLQFQLRGFDHVHPGRGEALERGLRLRREIEDEAAFPVRDGDRRHAVVEDVYLLGQTSLHVAE